MPTDDHQLVRQGGSQDSVGTPATGRGDRCQWGDPDAAKRAMDFLTNLEEMEDVQKVYSNLDVPEDVLRGRLMVDS